MLTKVWQLYKAKLGVPVCCIAFWLVVDVQKSKGSRGRGCGTRRSKCPRISTGWFHATSQRAPTAVERHWSDASRHLATQLPRQRRRNWKSQQIVSIIRLTVVIVITVAAAMMYKFWRGVKPRTERRNWIELNWHGASPLFIGWRLRERSHRLPTRRR